MADLHALFSSNNPSEYDAVEAPTDCRHQWAVDAAALGARPQDVASPCFDVEDLESLRTNLLVFHGAGGAGKSTLLRKIEAALTAREGKRTRPGTPPCRSISPTFTSTSPPDGKTNWNTEGPSPWPAEPSPLPTARGRRVLPNAPVWRRRVTAANARPTTPRGKKDTGTAGALLAMPDLPNRPR
ncbi:hypothetical protein [Streptomyces sp. NRRL F-2747]|uniref:hypothetical protein n=1 Tax=Streptomyces sp. NRRL F-2747 TaxID=1463843 RepID=UPI00131EB98E|nr:hypothetical protein [Streptomyces sp. NRRL F-2747]